MKSNRTIRKKTSPRQLSSGVLEVKVAILLQEESSLSLALLMRDVVLMANRGKKRPAYRVEFVNARGRRAVKVGGVSIDCSTGTGRYDYLIIPPLDAAASMPSDGSAETTRIKKAREQGTVLASACLGSLLLASAGVLDEREATTHWGWEMIAKSSFPKVNWDPKQMICDQGDVITAGGYLGAIDLVLHLIAKTSSKKIAHEIGRGILADSTRQKQSVYARSLIQPRREDPLVGRLERWIDGRLSEPLTVSELASFCGMSLRSFHRFFEKVYGVSPKKFIQLKRIERVQELLRNSSLSIEAAIESVGVSDVSSFRRVFQREMGVTPAEFRRRTAP